MSFPVPKVRVRYMKISEHFLVDDRYKDLKGINALKYGQLHYYCYGKNCDPSYIIDDDQLRRLTLSAVEQCGEIGDKRQPNFIILLWKVAGVCYLVRRLTLPVDQRH
ncbi:hypothetical protein BLOT_016348 [Blomia tropicalis]|nr:hypothetical protein BLOT_016348 [Blomia tropicalis]